MSEIKLGDYVRDKLTGFKGVAVARTEFVNGCVQFENVVGDPPLELMGRI
jgi:hypothetical protein